MKLPERFEEQMKTMLQQDHEAFTDSYEQDRHYGLRLNPLKDGSAVKEKLSFLGERVGWCKTGFYYEADARPAKSPLYSAGCYYIQEPSAMTSGEAMDVQPGEWVIDLCGAPGGKTTHMAGSMAGEGVIVANDISASRAKSMYKNVQMAGIRNGIVIGEDPVKIAEIWPETFDKVLVDAPCSGEGMFRKEPKLIQSWEESGPEDFVPVQRQILAAAYKMLKPGGSLVYSTCTYNTEENEGNIRWFLETHKDCHLMPVHAELTISQGIALDGDERLMACGRVWPHVQAGEGHFIAKISKNVKIDGRSVPILKTKVTREAVEQLEQFIRATGLKPELIDFNRLNQIKDRVYQLPGDTPDTKGLRVLGSGWLLGTVKKHGFEPSQAFASGLMSSEIERAIDFEYDNEDAVRFLKGESFKVATEGKGWYLVSVEGCGLGWGKVAGGRLKNKLEPSWRWM